MFDSWSEHFKDDVWVEVFEKNGIDPLFYTAREREEDELLPWDFIDIGVSKKFLWKEYQQARNEVVTPNCRQKCAGCGAMKFGGGVCFEGKN